MANKTIDDFTAVTVPAVTDTVIVTQAGVTKKETLAQVDTLLSATAKTLTNKTLTSPVINTGVSGTALASAAEITAGTLATRVIAPDQLKLSSPTVVALTVTTIKQTNTSENQSRLLQTGDIISDFVVTGLLPATSADLISDISAGKAYVTGTRVVKAVTSKTYTASKDTYVDVNSAGTYTFVEVALAADAPAITADSIRLAKVVTDVDNITGVTDLRKLTLTLPAPTVVLTGGQIAFPATAVPSAGPNTLDDYEEGTFTVALACGTSGTITLANNTLKYIKIGGQVTIGGRISTNAIDAPTGALTLTGLPFAVFNSEANMSAGSIFTESLAAASTTVPMVRATENTTTVAFYRYLDGAIVAMAADIDASSYLTIGVTYFII